MHLLKNKNKVYHLISKKKYSISLWQKKLEKLQNYIMIVYFQILVYHFNGPISDIDFNYSTDAETLFNDIKSKKIKFEEIEKKSNGI